MAHKAILFLPILAACLLTLADIPARAGQADEGWWHYADNWRVLAPDGSVLGTRKLLHPHVEEQPFTRSLDNVEIPDGIGEVVVRTHDKVHGHGGAKMTVTVPR